MLLYSLYSLSLCSDSLSLPLSSFRPSLALSLCSSLGWSSAGCTSRALKMPLASTATTWTDSWAPAVKERPRDTAAWPSGSTVCQISTDAAAPAMWRIQMLLRRNCSAATCSSTGRTFILDTIFFYPSVCWDWQGYWSSSERKEWEIKVMGWTEASTPSTVVIFTLRPRADKLLLCSQTREHRRARHECRQQTSLCGQRVVPWTLLFSLTICSVQNPLKPII